MSHGSSSSSVVRHALARRGSPRASRARPRSAAAPERRGRARRARRRRRRRRRPRDAPRSCSSAAATPPTLPKPCTTQRCPPSDQPSRSQARAITITTPAPVASWRKSEPPIEIGLPVTISGTAMPDLHRVGVHHPGHRLLVRGHVRRRDVLLRADDRQQLRGEAAGDLLQLVRREVMRVAAEAALGAAVGQPQERALPGHPHRQRGAFAERDLGVVADAALRRPEHASSAGRGSPGRPSSGRSRA